MAPIAEAVLFEENATFVVDHHGTGKGVPHLQQRGYANVSERQIAIRVNVAVHIGSGWFPSHEAALRNVTG